MNPFWTQVVIHTTLKGKKNNGATTKYSNYELIKGMRELKSNLGRLAKDVVLIVMGIFSAAFGFKGLLMAEPPVFHCSFRHLPLGRFISCSSVSTFLLSYSVITL
jgi:hypothetical protein